MKPPTDLSPTDWARRVNRTWIVRGHLNEHAEVWLDHLATLGDGRLHRACAAARAMCALRGPLDDPKPWFYAGLFSPATRAETRRHLASHPVTKAALPLLSDDPDVVLWLDRAKPETRQLVARLRAALTRLK